MAYPTSKPTHTFGPGFCAQNPNTNRPLVAMNSPGKLVGNLLSGSAKPWPSCLAWPSSLASEVT